MYGYFEDCHRLIPAVILACLRGQDIKLSSPHSVRDFVFIDDVVGA
jgi:dTDP-D-glucose 4,6-dehydratase